MGVGEGAAVGSAVGSGEGAAVGSAVGSGVGAGDGASSTGEVVRDQFSVKKSAGSITPRDCAQSTSSCRISRRSS